MPLPEEQCDGNDRDFSEVSATSSESSEENLTRRVVEEDGLQYLAGWLARKFIKKYPHLGNHRQKSKEPEHSYCVPSWGSNNILWRVNGTISRVG